MMAGFQFADGRRAAQEKLVAECDLFVKSIVVAFGMKGNVISSFACEI